MKKLCKSCGIEKNFSAFYKDAQKKDGLTVKCKNCMKLCINRERRRKYEKEYRLKNYEKRKEIVKKSMKKNSEHHKAKRAEYLKTPEGMAMYKRQTQKRYALRKNAFVEDVNIVEMFNSSQKTCEYCGKGLTIETMTIDHFIPLAKGGKHERKNLRISCSHCNLSKGPKLYHEWRPQNRMV